MRIKEALGCEFVYGNLEAAKPFQKKSNDQERFILGHIEIEVLHTPGLTPDSCCIVIYEQNEIKCLFPGDLLLIGDVGMPDLSMVQDDSEKDDICV